MVHTIFKIESDHHRIAHSVQKRTTRKMASSYPGLLPGKSINSNWYSLQSIISSLPSIAVGVPFVGSQKQPNFFVTSWKVNHILSLLLLLLPIWFSLPIYNLFIILAEIFFGLSLPKKCRCENNFVRCCNKIFLGQLPSICIQMKNG